MRERVVEALEVEARELEILTSIEPSIWFDELYAVLLVLEALKRI